MKTKPETGARFALGRTVASSGAMHVLRRAGLMPSAFLYRHRRGDWGQVDPYEKFENDMAVLLDNGPIRSTYTVTDQFKLVVITEADRSMTMMLLNTEY